MELFVPIRTRRLQLEWVNKYCRLHSIMNTLTFQTVITEIICMLQLAMSLEASAHGVTLNPPLVGRQSHGTANLVITRIDNGN